MKMRNYLLTAFVAAGLVAGAGSAGAAPIVFYGLDQNPGSVVPAGGNAETARNAFLGSLSMVGTEDFETLANGTVDPFSLTFPGSIGNLSATLSSPQTVTVTTADPVGQFSTSGAQHLDADFGTTINIDFSSTPISAFGFYGTDISDSGGDLVVDLVDVNNIVSSFTVIQDGSNNNGNVLFWGFVDASNSYTNIALRNTSSSDRFGFDDMTIGDQAQVTVPEPATLGLLGLGLVGLGFAARRRR